MKKIFTIIASLALAACATGGTESPVIAAPPSPSFSVTNTQADEATKELTFVITKSGNNKNSASVNYTTKDGTATAGSDYTAIRGVVNFTAKQNSAKVTVPVSDDNVVEPDETLQLIISEGNNSRIGNSTAEGTIINDDNPPATQTCADGTIILATETCPSPPPTQTCQDGTVISSLDICPSPPVECSDGTTVPAGQSCPEPTTSADTPGGVNNPLKGQAPGVGAPDIPTTDHDVMQDMKPDIGGPAPQPAGETLGAFRFVCRHTSLLYDDPTVFYQQPGKSHLHDQTGNYLWNAYSNYGNLRTGGGSGCNQVAEDDYLNKPVADAPKELFNHAGNRTPYWQAALFDGKGNVILADLTVFYYKRYPADSAECTQHLVSAKGCVPLPNGLKFIFGADVGNPAQPFPTELPSWFRPYFLCEATGEKFDSIPPAAACAQAHDGNMDIVADAPTCWNGIDLDTPDHRSHLAYVADTHLGYAACPATHPYIIPGFTYKALYTITPTDDPKLIKLSCDDMDPTKPHGWCFHVDYGPAAWDPIVLKMWTDNCINKKLSCNSGELGGGYILKGAGQPIYNVDGVFRSLWKNPQRLVPIPPKPVGNEVPHVMSASGERG